MPRSRSLKPSFFTNEDLGECSPLARLFFAGLWCWADREGYVEDRPRRLRAQILPYDDISGESLVAELVGKGLVERLVVNGENVLFLPTFTKHQDPHPRETPSRFAQGAPKANLGGDEQVTSPASPSCPSSPSSPSSLPAPQTPLASLPGWLAGIQEILSQELGRPIGVGKDPAAVVDAFTRRREYHQAAGAENPDDYVVGDCLVIAKKRARESPGTLAFFVGWLNNATPTKAVGRG